MFHVEHTADRCGYQSTGRGSPVGDIIPAVCRVPAGYGVFHVKHDRSAGQSRAPGNGDPARTIRGLDIRLPSDGAAAPKGAAETPVKRTLSTVNLCRAVSRETLCAHAFRSGAALGARRPCPTRGKLPAPFKMIYVYHLRAFRSRRFTPRPRPPLDPAALFHVKRTAGGRGWLGPGKEMEQRGSGLGFHCRPDPPRGPNNRGATEGRDGAGPQTDRTRA